MWVVDASLLTHEMSVSNGQLYEWNGSKQYPLFHLDEKVLGIAGPAHAIQIAKQILDPFDEHNLSIIVEKVNV